RLLRVDHLVCRLQRQPGHRPLPGAFCPRLLVHRSDVIAARPLRAAAFWSSGTAARSALETLSRGRVGADCPIARLPDYPISDCTIIGAVAEILSSPKSMEI